MMRANIKGYRSFFLLLVSTFAICTFASEVHAQPKLKISEKGTTGTVLGFFDVTLENPGSRTIKDGTTPVKLEIGGKSYDVKLWSVLTYGESKGLKAAVGTVKEFPPVGKHKVKVTITLDDGSTISAEGDCTFELPKEETRRRQNRDLLIDLFAFRTRHMEMKSQITS